MAKKSEDYNTDYRGNGNGKRDENRKNPVKTSASSKLRRIGMLKRTVSRRKKKKAGRECNGSEESSREKKVVGRGGGNVTQGQQKAVSASSQKNPYLVRRYNVPSPWQRRSSGEAS